MREPIKSENTRYGFDFGSMEVTRVANDRLTAIINIKTKKASLNVRATKNGSMRIYDEHGNECEIVNKDYIKSLPQSLQLQAAQSRAKGDKLNEGKS